MKTKDLAAIGSAALVTATLTVATLFPNALNADGNEDGIVQKVALPTFKVDGAEITLVAADGRTFKAGDEPVFELKAINTTDKPVELAMQVTMNATPVAETISRMMPRPALLWTTTTPLKLKAHETKTVTLETHAKLPANNAINVLLNRSDSNGLDRSKVLTTARDIPTVMAMSFVTLQQASFGFTPGNATSPTAASSEVTR